jgi:hypothetical protein
MQNNTNRFSLRFELQTNRGLTLFLCRTAALRLVLNSNHSSLKYAWKEENLHIPLLSSSACRTTTSANSSRRDYRNGRTLASRRLWAVAWRVDSSANIPERDYRDGPTLASQRFGRWPACVREMTDHPEAFQCCSNTVGSRDIEVGAAQISALAYKLCRQRRKQLAEY